MSSYGDNGSGTLQPLGSTATDAGTVDATATPDGQYLYVQAGAKGIVDEYRVGQGGSLAEIGSVTVPRAADAEGIGIDRAAALGLADAGASVILLARSDTQLAETRALLLARGAAAGQRIRAAGAALAAGRIDILINNAATVEPIGATAAIPAAELRRAFEVNVVAPAALTAAILPGMLDAGWGRIVNVSSGIAAHPDAMIRFNAYAATKAALEAHTVNLAAELRGTGVAVHAYRPGGVDTAMQAWIRQQDPERVGTALHVRFNRSYADGALITPERSAAALIGYLS